jgi:hypothetical protein
LRGPRSQWDAGKQGSKVASENWNGLGFPEPAFQQTAPGVVRSVQGRLWSFGWFRGRL